MATPFVLLDAKVYLGQFDVSGRSNQVTMNYEYPKAPAHAFGGDAHYSIPGIPDINMDFSGLAVTDGTDDSEDAIASRLSVANVPVSVGYSGADGTPGYFTKALTVSETLGGSIGDVFGFQVNAAAQGYKLVRGYYMAPRSSRTSSTSGTVKQIGAVGASQSVYAVLHVFAASGTSPTLDVIVESDDAGGFASAATKISFTQATTLTSEIKSAAGPITDDYWRVSWTIGGSDTPTFDFAVLVGII